MTVLLSGRTISRFTIEFLTLFSSRYQRNVSFDRRLLDYNSKINNIKANFNTNSFRMNNKNEPYYSVALRKRQNVKNARHLASEETENDRKRVQVTHKNNNNTLKDDDVYKNEDESDMFGLLDKMYLKRAPELNSDDYEDEGDKKEAEYLSRRPNTKNTMFWYSLRLKKLTGERKLVEALEYFRKMIEVDRVKPDGYAYGVLIAGCGREGYTKMAFKLYRQMKDRGLSVHSRVYTSLFNACGNSPWTNNGLKHATRLYEEIMNKGIILNNTNYHAAIKAFGRCKDLPMAFRLVDDMIENKVAITTETFNFLLSSCASDRTTGFLHAIQIWRKLREKRVKPDIYSYNLLLRATRDCGLGNSNVASELLLNSPSNKNEQKPLNNTLDSGKSLPSDTVNDVKRIGDPNSNVVSVASYESKLPDILSPRPNISSVVSFNSVDTAQDRFLMLGGLDGILRRMNKDKIRPNLKTLTELIEVIPADDETALVEVLDENNIDPDVDFFNVLLKKRNCRGDYNGAKEVLSLIAQRGLYVDLATFGALSIGCKRWRDAEQLLNDMEASGFRPNIKILGAFVKIACYSRDFRYLMEVMKRIKSEEIEVDAKILDEMENFIVKTKKYIVKQEKAGLQSKLEKFNESFRIFLLYYSRWLKERPYQSPEHPWKQFETKQTLEFDDDDYKKNKTS